MDGTIGEIRIFAGPFAPRYWAFCNGQTILINDNQSLFSIIGALYGGDAIKDFKLPDAAHLPAMPADTKANYIICTQGVYPSRN